MRFSDSEHSLEWIKQFKGNDILIAKSIVDSLRLVSSREVEVELLRMVQSIINAQSQTAKIALIPVSKKFVDEKASVGSEDKIAYALENIRRDNTNQISTYASDKIEASNEEVISKGYTDVIFLEDFSSSGQRLDEFVKKWITKKIRSKVSAGKLTLHISCYSIYSDALKKISKISKSLRYENIHYSILIEDKFQYFCDQQLEFFRREAFRAEDSYNWDGFGGKACPIIFEHSCPDNVPSLLWSNGTDYRALFPSRTIPADLKSFFDNEHRTPFFNILERLGRSKLKQQLALFEQASYNLREISTYLAILSQGVQASNLSRYLVKSPQEISAMLELLEKSGLVSSDQSISLFGRDFLNSVSRKFHKRKKITTQKHDIYLPTQLNNVFRGDQ